MTGFDPDVFGGSETQAGFDPDVFSAQAAARMMPKDLSKKKVNAAYESGRSAEGWKQGLASVINGPLMGFGDEIGGAIGATIDKLKPRSITDLVTGPKSWGDHYTANRDKLRGMQDRQREENPWTTGITQAMASAPLMLLNPGAAAGSAPVGIVGNSMRAAATGGLYGAVGGAGNSTAEDLTGVGVDALRGGATGAAIGGVSTPVIAGMGAAGRNVMQRVSDTSAAAYAREKLAEAFARDARGSVFAGGASNPAVQAEARLNKLGPQGAVVDAGGRNTNQLLDTLTTLPGRTKESVFNFQRQRAAGAGERLRGAADSALGTSGQRLATTLDDLETTRRAAAAPLYDQLRGVAVTVDDDLLQLLNRTRGHHGEAQNLHRLATGEEIALGGLQKGQSVPFQMLDHLKQSLDDAGMAAKTGGNNKMGLAVDSARVALLNKLDSVAPQAGGQSVYKAARDAYAGPSALMDAASAGRKAITQDESAITSVVRGMSTSETEAFRIGAFEGLRAKLGTQSGQTNILNMWKEPATREKLKVIFGDERSFREFAAAASRESVMKRVQSVGQGSQTASRQAGMGDLDTAALTDAASALASAKTGNVLGVMGAARNAWGRVATPQTVRDEMGRLLLQQGPAAQQTIQGMGGLVNQINRNNGLLADSLGLTGGLIGGNLAQPLPLGLLHR